MSQQSQRQTGERPETMQIAHASRAISLCARAPKRSSARPARQTNTPSLAKVCRDEWICEGRDIASHNRGCLRGEVGEESDTRSFSVERAGEFVRGRD